jgi:hypothetical protein
LLHRFSTTARKRFHEAHNGYTGIIPKSSATIAEVLGYYGYATAPSNGRIAGFRRVSAEKSGCEDTWLKRTGHRVKGQKTLVYYIGSWSLEGMDDAFLFVHVDESGKVSEADV